MTDRYRIGAATLLERDALRDTGDAIRGARGATRDADAFLCELRDNVALGTGGHSAGSGPRRQRRQKMKNRIRWTVGAVALVAGLGMGMAVPGYAQEPAQHQDARVERQRPDRKQMLERRVAFMTERLNLTEDQAARVREVFEKQAEQRKAIFEKAGFEPGKARGPRDGRARGERRVNDDQRAAIRTEMRQLHEQTEQELAKILDEEQQNRYEELKKEMRRRGPRGGERRGGK